MSQIQRIVARTGLAADVPALLTGELGWDTDLNVLRIGDATSTPTRILTSKSTGTFDFSVATSVKFKNLLISTDGLVDGLNLKTMNTAPGFVVRKASSGTFGPVTFGCSDSTLVVVNGDGQSGNVDIRIHPDVVSILIGTAYLQEVTHDATLTGTGEEASPLGVVSASTSAKGVIRLADQATASAGSSLLLALTPGHLAGMDTGGALALALQASVMANLDINTDASLTGGGGPVSLSVAQATETQKGGAEIAAQSEANNALDDTRILTTLKLASLSENGNTAVALRTNMRSKAGAGYTSISSSGSIVTLPTTLTDLTFLLEVTADASQNADAFYTAQTTVSVQMNIGGSWQTVIYCEAYDTGGAATGTNVPFHDSKKYVTGRVFCARTASIPLVSSPMGVFNGIWDGQTRVNVVYNGAGTVSAVPVGNAGSVVVRLVHI